MVEEAFLVVEEAFLVVEAAFLAVGAAFLAVEEAFLAVGVAAAVAVLRTNHHEDQDRNPQEPVEVAPYGQQAKEVDDPSSEAHRALVAARLAVHNKLVVVGVERLESHRIVVVHTSRLISLINLRNLYQTIQYQ